jgi:hypothetical protein
VADKWRSRDAPNWFLGVCFHSRIPAAENRAQIAVQHLGADMQQQVSASLGPVHLLLLHHSAADQLVHGIRQSNDRVDGGRSWSYRPRAQAAGVSSAMLRMERLARPGKTAVR